MTNTVYSADITSVNEVRAVLHGDFSSVDKSILVIAKDFVEQWKSGADRRTLFNETVTPLWNSAANMIFFFRHITLAEVMISFAEVPEFRPVVKVFSRIVREARNMPQVGL